MRAPALALAAAALSGALLFAGAGLHPLWWACWLAPIPVVWAAPRLGGWTAAGAAAAAWAAGATNAWSYLRSLHLPLGVTILATAAPGLVFGAAVALLRAFTLRGAALRAALAVPVVWVAYEHAFAQLGSQGTFGSLAYTQVDALPVLQLAALTGIEGISFTLLFLPCAVAVALTPALPWPRRRMVVAVAGAAAAVVLGFGLCRLRSSPPARGTVTVGLAASDLAANVRTAPPDAAGRVLGEYLGQAEALARQGARLIVLPEKLAELGPVASALDAGYQALADAADATIAVGVTRVDGAAVRNEARVYLRGAAAPATYAKRHLLPGWEARFTPGDARLSVKDGRGTWAVAICKDLDFPATARAHREDGVDLVLVPAWDFDRDAWLHARMAVVRGVEGGFGVVRAAKQGLLTVADDRGRILAERSSAAAPFSTLTVEVPLRRDGVSGAALAGAFGWADLAALALLLGTLAARGRPAAAGRSAP